MVIVGLVVFKKSEEILLAMQNSQIQGISVDGVFSYGIN